MAAASGIWSSAAPGTARPSDTPTSGSGSGNADSAMISANDFLTLLVTEMQNQDPTATTDPNEYINQLVNVNSLEQLISINQTLQTATGSSSNTTNPGARQPGASGFDPFAVRSPATSTDSKNQNLATQSAPGNLSVPLAEPAAGRVATALLR